MNDIEKLKKLNRMIPEMKRYGFATTNDEAARKTEEIFSTELVRNTAIQQQPQQPAEDKQPQQQLESRLANMETRIADTVSKVNEIIKLLNELEQRLAKQTVNVGAEAEKKLVEAQSKIAVDEKAEPNPKNGRFTPENIDIREYFNFSKR